MIRSNCKFSVLKPEYSASYGVAVSTVVVQGLEAYVEDISTRLLNTTPFVDSIMSLPEEFIMLVYRQTYMTNTYIDRYASIVQGSRLQITHYRHPKLPSVWVALSVPLQFVVSKKRTDDPDGNVFQLFLKDEGMVS